MFHYSADIYQTRPMIGSTPVIDPAALQMVLGALTGWLERREREAIAYLIEENRLLAKKRIHDAGTWPKDIPYPIPRRSDGSFPTTIPKRLV